MTILMQVRPQKVLQVKVHRQLRAPRQELGQRDIIVPHPSMVQRILRYLFKAN